MADEEKQESEASINKPSSVRRPDVAKHGAPPPLSGAPTPISTEPGDSNEQPLEEADVGEKVEPIADTQASGLGSDSDSVPVPAENQNETTSESEASKPEARAKGPPKPPVPAPAAEGESEQRQEEERQALSLADELGIQDLTDPVFGGRGRLFSAAGRQSPVGEFTKKFLVLHPPQLPFQELDNEDIVIKANERGVVLDELGQERKIPGAKYHGHPIFWHYRQRPGTLKHFAAWFDERGQVHYLYVNEEPLTTEIVFKLRNKTHDGEISIFPDLTSDDEKSPKPNESSKSP